MLKENKYKSIYDVFGNYEIKEDYIYVKDKVNYYSVYIYKINPLVLLDTFDQIKENIVLKYKEFLRQVNFEFQTIILNQKYCYENYIDYLNHTEFEKNSFFYNYTIYMKELFENQNIYETSFYMVIKIADNQNIDAENVDNTLNILNSIGCNIEKLSNNDIYNFLNIVINKE